MIELEARGLECGYHDRLALREVSVEVRAGETLALLGPNGAGKTTMLRALARLMRPRRGCVCLEGEDLWKVSARGVAKKVSLSPQIEGRHCPLSVEEAVLLGRSPHCGWLTAYSRQDREMAHESIRRCGLESLVDRPITELSGGEWRRVLLARAIAQRPRVLLLDEPTANLDLRHQLELLELVQRLARQEGLAVVVTLHDLNHASACADRIALLDGGLIVAIGSPDDVLTVDRIRAAYGVEVTVLPRPEPWGPILVLDVPRIVGRTGEPPALDPEGSRR